MKKYTVQQLSKLAGVSVRTLHYYDSIGLLSPDERSEKNYRFYTRTQLLRLQQILFYKELDIPLKEIAELLDNPDYDAVKALKEHKQLLLQKNDRLNTLIQTIDKTIETMSNNNYKMTDEELYEGFSKEKVEEMRTEVKERWGEQSLTDTENKVKGWGKEKFNQTKQQGEDIVRNIAANMHLGVEDEQVQKLIAQYHQHLNQYREMSKEGYVQLGEMYATDERFKAYYENYAEGLATFMQQAIAVYGKGE